jgi:hypothetical protein
MTAEGGLGRSLADIRRDLERVAHDESLILGPAGSRLLGDVHRLTEGAEPRGDEFAQLTAGEAWGWLLEMPPDKRLAWLGNVLEAARDGSMCHDQNHRGRIASLEERALPLLTVRAEDTERNPADLMVRLRASIEDAKRERTEREGPADA